MKTVRTESSDIDLPVMLFPTCSIVPYFMSAI